MGGLDSVVTRESSLKVTERIQYAKVLEMASAGHYPFLTHALAINGGQIDFIHGVES